MLDAAMVRVRARNQQEGRTMTIRELFKAAHEELERDAVRIEERVKAAQASRRGSASTSRSPRKA